MDFYPRYGYYEVRFGGTAKVLESYFAVAKRVILLCTLNSCLALYWRKVVLIEEIADKIQTCDDEYCCMGVHDVWCKFEEAIGGSKHKILVNKGASNRHQSSY